MYKYIRSKVPFMKKYSEEMTLLLLYRFLSLAITSFFYLISMVEHTIERKLFIIACISVASLLINYLYFKSENSRPKILLLIFIETLGNSVILIPSGGLNSPYVWYSLNTILVSCLLLKGQYCWINLFIYLLSSTCVSYLNLNQINSSILFIVREETNLTLSLILITAVIQQLSTHISIIKTKSQKLSTMNDQLKLANEAINEAMNYTVELYQAVHLLTSQEDKEKLVELIVDYTVKITKTKSVVFYDVFSNNCTAIDTQKNSNHELEDQIKAIISERVSEMQKNHSLEKVKIGNNQFILESIKTNYNFFGVLGIQIDKEDIQAYENINQLNFLSDLSAIALEKMKLEKVNERLIINQEQNRIADEIHDGILQKLFAMSCRLAVLLKKKDNMEAENLSKEISIIRNSINIVMKDLRGTVYGLSWKKDGSNNFLEDISNYIDEVSQLHQVDVKIYIKGSHDILTTQQKKYFYRIICEGIGNSIRHGKSRNVEVNLNIESKRSILEIGDDGIGFDTSMTNINQNHGLGLKNFEHMTNQLNGELTIQSVKGQGSKITISVPNNQDYLRRIMYEDTVS